MQYYICRKNSSNVNFADKKSLRIFLEENFAPMVEEAISKFMDSEIYDKGQTYTRYRWARTKLIYHIHLTLWMIRKMQLLEIRMHTREVQVIGLFYT